MSGRVWINEFFDSFEDTGAYFSPDDSTTCGSYGDLRTGENAEKMVQTYAELGENWLLEARDQENKVQIKYSSARDRIQIDIYSDQELQETIKIESYRERDPEKILDDMNDTLEPEASTF